MTLQRRPQIPVKGPDIIALHAQSKGIHNTNQLFGVSIARAGEYLKHLAGGDILACLHQITRFFDFSNRGTGPKPKKKCYLAHALVLAAAPVSAQITADDYIPADPAQARLGQLLFYDKILSGNQNISCGTCHHHDHAGTDGLSLGIGEGGQGVGPERTTGTGDDAIRKRIPRNAPALWNLGHKDIRVLFHDGRLSASDIYGNGFNSPAEEWLPKGLDNIVAAQAVFPMVAQFEMAGNPRENEIAGAVHDRIDAAWPIIAKRVRTIPAYGDMFVSAFPHIETSQDVTIVEIANALGAFITTEWRSYDSPYDAYLNGTPLAANAERGRALFFGDGGCVQCHSGPLFTDQEFRALGLPAFGPGRTRRFDPIPRDVGRMGKTNFLEDAYRFRTPSLRNVALTAPYGHNGAYPTLQAMIGHHLDPLGSRAAWTLDEAALPNAPWIGHVDLAIQADAREMARQTASIEISLSGITKDDIADLEAFLHALTGKTAETRPLGRPETVPSGLPVD